MPARSRILRLVVVVTLALVALGCGTATPTAVPGSSDAAPAPGTSAGAACAVETPPGPDDTVPGPGEMDVSDLGNGRWRLCLVEPAAFSVEGSAWCTWLEDRSEVREVSGLPTPIGAAGSTVDGGIAIDRGEVYLASNDPRMIFSWQGGPSDMQAEVGAAGRSGTTSFRIPAIVDPEHPPAIPPPEAAGVINWLCGDPPPPG